MSLSDVLSVVDSEISRLEQARKLLASDGALTRRGVSARVSTAKPARTKRTLSPEARKRIAEAQRKRWAAQRSAK